MQGAGPPPALLAVVECIAANCIIGLQMPPARGQRGQGVVLNIYVLYFYVNFYLMVKMLVWCL